MATTKADLHDLIDRLSDRDLETAARVLQGLVRTAEPDEHTPGLRHLDAAPFDDEPLTDEDREAIRRGREDHEPGRVASLDEVKRGLGL